MIGFCTEKNLDYFESGGVKRYLASKPSNGKMKALLPNYSAAGNPVFPRSEWKPVNRRGLFDFIFDQDNHGSCTGNGWARALSVARAIAGMKLQILSPAWVYSLINGGMDQGAVISDGIAALQTVGACLYSTVGEDPIYQSQMPSLARAEAARFKLGAAYHCTSYDEVVSALLTGRFVPVYGYEVGRNFEDFDKFGVAGHARGPGNHCNMSDGLVQLADGRWVLDDANSWGGSWGPWNNGRVYIDEQHLFGGGDQADVCVIEAAVEDPNEPNEPPAYKE